MKIPLLEIALLRTPLFDRMVDTRGGRVHQALTGFEQTPAQLRVLSSDLAARGGSQIGAKSAVLLENFPPECEVRAKRRRSDRTGRFAEIKADHRVHEFVWAFHLEPIWFGNIPDRDYFPPDARATKSLEGREQLDQPLWMRGYVIIGECQQLSSRLCDTSV